MSRQERTARPNRRRCPLHAPPSQARAAVRRGEGAQRLGTLRKQGRRAGQACGGRDIPRAGALSRLGVQGPPPQAKSISWCGIQYRLLASLRRKGIPANYGKASIGIPLRSAPLGHLFCVLSPATLIVPPQ